MKLTVTTMSDAIISLDVSDDMELENFKALCEFETQIPATEQVVIWDGRPLHENKKKLKDYGLKDGEVVLVQHVRVPSTCQPGAGASAGRGLPQIDFSNIQIPQGGRSQAGPSFGLPDDPAAIRDMLLSSPHEVAVLKESNPPLAEALVSGSLEKFTEVLRKQQKERLDRERERIRLLSADPFDAEVQSQIAEEIRLKNVESNMETAMEYAPESFGQVLMLYIDVSVNGHDVKAFVDSGAQMTIMSKACAERCNIERLVDKRWAGIAKGVGTQRIIGRVHLGQIKIGSDYLQSSFSILEDQPMDMLLGLDMLRRHQCSIDLKNNVLVIGTTGSQTPFLSESEVPEHARLNRNPSVTDMEGDDHALAEALARSSEEAATAKPGSSSSQGTSSTASSFPEANISKLVSHGFSRQQVIEELRKAQGNVDQALAALFAKSFQMP